MPWNFGPKINAKNMRSSIKSLTSVVTQTTRCFQSSLFHSRCSKLVLETKWNGNTHLDTEEVSSQATIDADAKVLMDCGKISIKPNKSYFIAA